MILTDLDIDKLICIFWFLEQPRKNMSSELVEENKEKAWKTLNLKKRIKERKGSLECVGLTETQNK